MVKVRQINRGLTLIEVLLVISIMSIMSLCVYNVLRTGLLFGQRGHGKSDFYQEIRDALDLMALDIENMVPYDFSSSYPDRTAFQGHEAKVTFIKADGDQLKVISYFLDWPQRGTIHKTIVGKTSSRNATITIENQSPNEMFNLVREEKSFVDDLSQGNEAAFERETIIERIPPAGLKFFYGYLQEAESKTLTWKDGWALKDIPRHVRIEIKFESPDHSQTIPMTKDVLIPHGVNATS